MDRRAFVSTVALGLLAALSVAQDRRQWDLVEAAGLVIRGFPCAPPSRARSHPRPCTDGRPRGELQVRNASPERTSAPATVRQTRVHAAPLLSPRGPRAVPVGPPPPRPSRRYPGFGRKGDHRGEAVSIRAVRRWRLAFRASVTRRQVVIPVASHGMFQTHAEPCRKAMLEFLRGEIRL
jgi:hypothetical protein